MKVIELLKQTDPKSIFKSCGVSIAMNEKDYNNQRKKFLNAYDDLLKTKKQDNDFVIFLMSSYFYEMPAGRGIDAFMFNKNDINKYQHYDELEEFMVSDLERNKKIARLKPKEINEILKKTPQPNMIDMKSADWKDILNAELIENKEVKNTSAAACIVDLMMSFDTDENKSHKSYRKISKENEENPMTFGTRKKTAFARHVYEYNILQTLSHRK
jgi:hypothetical protein